MTCLDLGPYGAVLTMGWDRQAAQTGAGAKQIKQSISSEWIYSPRRRCPGDHRTTWPTEAIEAAP